MAGIALKVDVDTFAGTANGVPPLLELFDRRGVRATLLFSVGPDNTGRAIRRVFRRGFISKVRRTSVVSNYGLRTLLNGVLLPGPRIGRRLGQLMREARQAGHEVGLHAYDHVAWQDKVERRSLDWTRREMLKGVEEFTRAVGEPPDTFGAAGWQVNSHVPVLEDELGFAYASDTRGASAFHPLGPDGRAAHCVQLPTTLPTLDELLGVAVRTEPELVRSLLDMTSDVQEDQVYTLHAELEGLKFIGCLDQLLLGWRDQGHVPGRLRDNFERLQSPVDVRRIGWIELPGRTGKVAAPEINEYQRVQVKA